MMRSPQGGLRQSLEIAHRRGAVALAAILLAACQPPNSSGPLNPQPVGDSWNMYRGDLARDGHPSSAMLDAAAAAHLRLAWRTHLHGAVVGTPAVGRGLAGAARPGRAQAVGNGLA